MKIYSIVQILIGENFQLFFFAQHSQVILVKVVVLNFLFYFIFGISDSDSRKPEISAY